MTRNVDDIHCYDSGFINAMARLEGAATSQKNKELINGFVMDCRRDELAKSTTTNYLNLLTRMTERLKETGYTKNLGELDQSDFDKLLLHLEVRGISTGEIRNYKKVLKKFFRWKTGDDLPKWVDRLKLKSVDSTVQPSDLLTQSDIDKMLAACRHPRNKAFIAVLLDSGMRVGALASTRIKNVEFNQTGAIIYISKTSKSNKSTAPKGIPLIWSAGFLNQWLAIHPLKDNREAPLWTTLTEPHEALSYNAIRVTLQEIAETAGVTKRVNPHSFRHKAITSWVLDRLSEQEIKHRAGWSKGSNQMLKIYANFTDNEINDQIYERYGLKKDEKRQVTLEKCPRCFNVLRPSDRVCSQCSLVLDKGMLKELEDKNKLIPDVFTALQNDPKFMRLLSETMAKVKV